MTQRQYAWGGRTNAEQAVIRLFDSLYRNYPIGAFLLWETRESVPFRQFMQEFDPEQDRAESAEQTRWPRRKFLVSKRFTLACNILSLVKSCAS
jgi:hypothetical protein